MNEQPEDTEIPEVEPEQPVVEEVVAEEPAQTIPKARLDEVIAQRESERAAKAQLAYENELLKQQLAQQRTPPQAPQQSAAYWEQYTDPNTRALAKLTFEAAQAAANAANAPLKQQLQRYEQIVEKQEFDTFWSRYPSAPVELKQHAEKVYATARSQGMDIDRRTALIFARGELAEMNESAALQSAQQSVTQQRVVNAAARTPTAASPTPGLRPSPSAKNADEILQQLINEDFAPRKR